MPMSGDDVVKALTAHGFVFRQGKGSHKIGKHSDGRTTTVPMHRELKRGTLASIERHTGVKLED